jgi:hypothetical protein
LGSASKWIERGILNEVKKVFADLFGAFAVMIRLKLREIGSFVRELMWLRMRFILLKKFE